MIWLLVYLVFHLACAVVTYIGMFGFFQREYPTLAKDDYIKDVIWGICYGIFLGPIGLAISFFMCERFKYGFKWK